MSSRGERLRSGLRAALALALCTTGGALAQPVDVLNPSFEEGADQPAGWSLSSGSGGWTEDAYEGARAVTVTGGATADASNHWRTEPIAFEPGALYRLRFHAKRLEGATGCVVSGPAFANRDYYGLPDGWNELDFVFAAPTELPPDTDWLRFGQWQNPGTVAFDAIALARVDPIYETRDGIALGDGERIDGDRYVFNAALSQVGGNANHARPLTAFNALFNTNRWVFGGDTYVVYRHEVGDLEQRAADVRVSVNYHVRGSLLVEASADGSAWVPVGRLDGTGALEAALPAELLPARSVWVRLRSRPAQEGEEPAALQVDGYTYEATLAQAPGVRSGRTLVVVSQSDDPSVRVQMLGVGDPDSGESALAVRLRVANDGDEPRQARPLITQRSASGEEETEGAELTLDPGEQLVAVPYALSGMGRIDLTLQLDGVGWRGETSFFVSPIHAAHYGERLPGSSDAVGLWWASSGWKVSRTRPAPGATGKAVRIAAARGEAEAAQLVLRPAERIEGLEVGCGDLSGPGGAVIPAARVDLLRVGYVPVTQPSDEIGATGPWPDPLPPIAGPLVLEADANQPIWVRVRVPRNAAAGVYRGRIRLKSEDYAAEAPLEVEVFGFDLPDRMTCTTAFGFNPSLVFRYHNVTDDAQQRDLLARYFSALSAHHISPYDPAPLDPFRVSWPGASDWDGGVQDRETVHAGVSSLRVEDASTSAAVSAGSRIPAPIPADGVVLRFDYKTHAPGHRFIVSLNHFDAAGVWMPGKNLDIPVTGDGTWQAFSHEATAFPEGAASFTVTLWATEWTEQGEQTGTVWFDDLVVSSRADEATLLANDFEPLAPEELAPAIDWSAWDSEVSRAVNDLKFNSFRIPIQGMGGGDFMSRTEPSLLGYAEDTPEYQAAFRAYCQAVQEHLRSQGWLDEAYVYWFDEPEPRDYAFVMNGFRKLREAAPDIRGMLTEQVEPELIGGPRIWCPLTPAYDEALAAERRAAGETFWWYVCTGPKTPYAGLFIDHPATDLRVWLWQTWKRRIEGVLIWETVYWTSPSAYPDALQNPYADPMGWVAWMPDLARGTKLPWGNGDGRFLYPPESAADGGSGEPILEGPVDSIRLEMLRDGIEDYEYHAMLERLLAERGDRLGAEERRRYEALLDVPDAVSANLTEFTWDPAPIEARRAELAKAIARLSR